MEKFNRNENVAPGPFRKAYSPPRKPYDPPSKPDRPRPSSPVNRNAQNRTSRFDRPTQNRTPDKTFPKRDNVQNRNLPKKDASPPRKNFNRNERASDRPGPFDKPKESFRRDNSKDTFRNKNSSHSNNFRPRSENNVQQNRRNIPVFDEKPKNMFAQPQQSSSLPAEVQALLNQPKDRPILPFTDERQNMIPERRDEMNRPRDRFDMERRDNFDRQRDNRDRVRGGDLFESIIETLSKERERENMNRNKNFGGERRGEGNFLQNVDRRNERPSILPFAGNNSTPIPPTKTNHPWAFSVNKVG